jgi:hypothetical protein
MNLRKKCPSEFTFATLLVISLHTKCHLLIRQLQNRKLWILGSRVGGRNAYKSHYSRRRTRWNLEFVWHTSLPQRSLVFTVMWSETYIFVVYCQVSSINIASRLRVMHIFWSAWYRGRQLNLQLVMQNHQKYQHKHNIYTSQWMISIFRFRFVAELKRQYGYLHSNHSETVKWKVSNFRC